MHIGNYEKMQIIFTPALLCFRSRKSGGRDVKSLNPNVEKASGQLCCIFNYLTDKTYKIYPHSASHHDVSKTASHRSSKGWAPTVRGKGTPIIVNAVAVLHEMCKLID